MKIPNDMIILGLFLALRSSSRVCGGSASAWGRADTDRFADTNKMICYILTLKVPPIEGGHSVPA